MFAAIAIAFAIAALGYAGLSWRLRRLDARVLQLQSELDSLRAVLTRPSARTLRPSSPASTDAEAIAADPEAARRGRWFITYDSFTEVWAPEHRRRAEERCWAKAPGPETLPNELHFVVTVDGGGKVIDVVADVPQAPAGDPPYAPASLYECVSREIKTMTFTASGKVTTGRVQADRVNRR
jgi:hypothetical protein